MIDNLYACRRVAPASADRRSMICNWRSLVALPVLLFIFISEIAAQQANVPINFDWMQESEARDVMARGFDLDVRFIRYESDTALINCVGENDSTKGPIVLSMAVPLHTSMRPWIEQGHPIRKNVILQNANGNYYTQNGSLWKWLGRYHNNRSLLQVEREPQNDEQLFHLYIDPLLNLQYMNVADDTSQAKFYINTRGVTARGDIGHKVSFETSFWENQAFFPKYIADFANATQVVPGQGRWKKFKQDTVVASRYGYDFAMASGYVSYSPCKNFNLQVGTGKHFVGDGYRSLLLSDNTFNYPFARLTGWFGPDKMFQYTTIYASLMNLKVNAPIPVGTEHLYQKKAASFYQLAAKIGRVGEVSLFQGLIWSAADSTNKQHINLGYVNPVIFTSLPFSGLSDRNNYLIGGTIRFDLLKTVRIYGQWMADDLGKKGTVHHKCGFQLGVKYFNAFTLKHLHLEYELNRVNPYSYAATDPDQAYTHYAQPLAHPLGANFSESIFTLQYKIGDFFLQARYSLAVLGVDSINVNNYGQDVFKTDYQAYYPVNGDSYKIGQGDRTDLTYLDVHLGYMISYASNLNVTVGYTSRNLTSNATSGTTSYVYVAVRTSLTNTYFDFFRN